MSNSVKGLAVVIVGLIINNFAYLSDLMFQDSGVVDMGIKTGLVAVVGILVTLVGAWMASHGGDAA